MEESFENFADFDRALRGHECGYWRCCDSPPERYVGFACYGCGKLFTLGLDRLKEYTKESGDDRFRTWASRHEYAVEINSGGLSGDELIRYHCEEVQEIVRRAEAAGVNIEVVRMGGAGRVSGCLA
jgi:hypothetical protein